MKYKVVFSELRTGSVIVEADDEKQARTTASGMEINWDDDFTITSVTAKPFNAGLIEELWEEFVDVPMNPETECMEAPFLHFPAGTHREEIWHWFDERYSGGVYALLYGTKGED